MITRTITVEALWEQLLPLIRMKDQARARAIFAALPAEPAGATGLREALTDMDEETCHLCGKPVAVVWTAPDEMWATVTDRADGGGILCVRCFDERAFAKSILLRWVPQPLDASLAAAPDVKALDSVPVLAWWGGPPEPGKRNALVSLTDVRAALAAERKATVERIRADVHEYMEQANTFAGELKIDRDDFDAILDAEAAL